MSDTLCQLLATWRYVFDPLALYNLEPIHMQLLSRTREVCIILTCIPTCFVQYGFFSNKPLVKTNPMFDYKTKSCDETSFATVFVNSFGHG